MKITKTKLRQIINEELKRNENEPLTHAGEKMLGILDVGVSQVIGKYIMAKGVAEMVGENAGLTLGMAQAAPILNLSSEERLELFRGLSKQLHERSGVWKALRQSLSSMEYTALIKRVSKQFEAHLLNPRSSSWPEHSED
jgi:hypothetical protein